jgi:hypothetical protein
MHIKRKNLPHLTALYVLLMIILNEHIIIIIMKNKKRKQMKMFLIFVLLKVVMENSKPIIEVLLIIQLLYLIQLINNDQNNKQIKILNLQKYQQVYHNKNLYQILYHINQKVNKHIVYSKNMKKKNNYNP